MAHGASRGNASPATICSPGRGDTTAAPTGLQERHGDKSRFPSAVALGHNLTPLTGQEGSDATPIVAGQAELSSPSPFHFERSER